MFNLWQYSKAGICSCWFFALNYSWYRCKRFLEASCWWRRSRLFLRVLYFGPSLHILRSTISRCVNYTLVIKRWQSISDYNSRKTLSIFITAQCFVSVVNVVCWSLSVFHKPELFQKAELRITETTPHDAPLILVFWCQKISAKFKWGNQMQVGKLKSMTFDR